MKHTDPKDPLNDKDLEEKQKETKKQEPLREDKITSPEQTDQANDPSADGEHIADSATDEAVETPVVEPESVPNETVPSTGAPDPAPSAEELTPTTEDPALTAEEPAPVTEEPAPTAEEPAPVTEEPAPASEKPKESKKDEPEPESSDPAPTAEELTPTTEDPALTAEEPAPVTEEPAPAAKVSAPPAQTAAELIDDHEEKKLNESWDDDVDHEDHDTPATDTDVEQKKSGQVNEERLNFGLLSKEDLVKLLRDKLDNPGRGNIRKDVEEIKQAFYEKHNAVLDEKKQHFLDEGGILEDFKPADDPSETEIKDLLYKYRSLKAEFTRQLEKTKQENLIKKQGILEELRMLMEGQETFEITFRRFKDLQRKWFSAGVVPQQNLKDLWDSYNYFVDKFNDYVRINRELRALDLKKNLELKNQLCERTEELDKEPNVVQAFKILQKHHTRWREIGPVPRDDRDEVWDRFKNATSVINKKHQEYHSRLKESLYENLERKAELCDKVETIAKQVYESHSAWVEKTNQVLEIQKTWKTIGYAPKKDNNAIYSRFRKACDTFFGNKAGFYAAAFEEQKENLKLKVAITEKAETLSENKDWKETTTELIRLQKQWKEIGPVPRRDSDKLWRRFRAACDTFFSNKSKYFEDIDSTFEENMQAKEALIAEMDAFTIDENKKKNLEALDEFQSRFNEIGYVPSAKKDQIKEQFRLAQDRLLERIGMNESERSLFKFRNRVQGMMNAPRSEMKLNFERDKLVNKLQQLKNDIGVWENNIGFFKQSDSSEETIMGFNEKIEAARERIRVLEVKIRILDDMENAN